MDYEPFLELPLETYCSSVIELPEQEIEEHGLRALCDALLAPAGIGLEVINLHNNPGQIADTNTYHTPPHPPHGGPFNEFNTPMVRLLFTP